MSRQSLYPINCIWETGRRGVEPHIYTMTCQNYSTIPTWESDSTLIGRNKPVQIECNFSSSSRDNSITLAGAPYGAYDYLSTKSLTNCSPIHLSVLWMWLKTTLVAMKLNWLNDKLGCDSEDLFSLSLLINLSIELVGVTIRFLGQGQGMQTLI